MYGLLGEVDEGLDRCCYAPSLRCASVSVGVDYWAVFVTFSPQQFIHSGSLGLPAASKCRIAVLLVRKNVKTRTKATPKLFVI